LKISDYVISSEVEDSWLCNFIRDWRSLTVWFHQRSKVPDCVIEWCDEWWNSEAWRKSDVNEDDVIRVNLIFTVKS